MLRAGPPYFLQRLAAEALQAAHRELARDGYGLLIHVGYRPWDWQLYPILDIAFTDIR